MRPIPRASAPKSRWFLLGALAGAIATVLAGCSGRTRYTPPTTPMPPNAILLSEMMQQLSNQPGFTEAVLAQIDKGGKNGPALLTPKLADTLRKMILGKDWQGLNRFPGWTMRDINPTVRVAGKVLTSNPGPGDTAGCPTLSQSHREPGSPPASLVGWDRAGSKAPQASQSTTPVPGNCPPLPITTWIDLGPYSLDKQETISLEEPSTLPPFTTAGIVTDLGAGVSRGDGPNNLGPEHAGSQRLADALNRLAINKLDGAATFAVSKPSPAAATRRRSSGPSTAQTPEAVIVDLQDSGHTVTVTDSRYFANFGHFHYRARGSSGPAQDVMMPFWVNSQIIVPGSHGRPLLVPVSHAELEWHIRGPHVNADVSHYFGIDGKSEWRTMDTLDQPWVLRRDAHTYTGADAVEVTRLTGLVTVAYVRLHQAHPILPFGGYYALGVCQDIVAAIEKKMTGHATLFPNTADAELFQDPRDAEVNTLITVIPKDRDGRRPEPERIFGSLPTTDFHAITIPGLTEDLIATQAAWHSGTLQHTHGRRYWIARSLEALGVALAAFVVYRLRRPATAPYPPQQPGAPS